MKIGRHSMYRFVQRILGIEGDKEIQKYLNNNYNEVFIQLVQFVNEAALVIENYAPGRRDTLNYYINGDTLILTKPKKTELMTLYDITLDSESEVNSKKIRQYVKQIRTNNQKIKTINIKQAKQDAITKHLEYMVEYLGDDFPVNRREQLEKDIQESINICKDYAAEAKQLRMDYREMMSEMFIKLK